jgi:hypothetical protein
LKLKIKEKFCAGFSFLKEKRKNVVPNPQTKIKYLDNKKKLVAIITSFLLWGQTPK